MTSPTDDARCLRCASPLTKPDEERAIDDALGLDSPGLPEEMPAVSLGVEPDEELVDESFSSYEEPDVKGDRASAPDVDDDPWDLDISLAETRRLLGQHSPVADANDQMPVNEPLASLLQMAATSTTSQPSTASGDPQHKHRKQRSGEVLSGVKSIVAWTAICLGLTAFACGGVLLGWSVLGDRGELWSLGVPITLVGQVALLVGLCFQLDRLWSENRDTSKRLGQMDEQLDELRQSTRLLGTPYHSASQNFYAHLSEGASPKMLLSDLKGQIDLLSIRMGQQEDRR